ncbi:phage Gp37/Gp68 family protein [Burkholderia ubonensis]|uniref:phage Gp37/Gp68 family protein n=1 Tax=Burkholderia ubonensis TaxID=101571 RepID=UPI0007559211|nr:phage Gp37/Gp68 family protein [Burkholderia ubonensis]KUZ78256.1 hypothetical protein WI37_10950 [Burkholderia ubonensis]
MSENTNIEWCDASWNPWEGCQKVGPGCDHCYAESRNARFSGGIAINWGPGAPRRRTSPTNWRKPIAWNARPFLECRACGWRGDRTANVNGMAACPEIQCASLDVALARRRVFCASLADVFDNAAPPTWRAELFELIMRTPNLDWLLLTKRIGNVAQMLREIGVDRLPDNVWLGATIVNQAEADRDIPKLLEVPARVRFLSMEPLLGPVDLCRAHIAQVKLPRVDWVIVGGESGHGARPMHPNWARSLRDQCAAAGVAFNFKQHGEWAPGSGDFGAGRFEAAAVARNGRVAPGGHRAENYPAGAASCDGWAMVHRVGKKVAGRLLDGRTHDEFPDSRR